MTDLKPTPAQRRLLEALITNGGTGYASQMAKVATVRACRANGWIKVDPAKPFTVPKHSITSAGRAVVERKPRPPAERAKIAQDARSANARDRKHKTMAAELHATGEWLVMSRHEVIEMLARPEYREGFTPAFLRGYLSIGRIEAIEVHANQDADGEV